MMSRVYPKEIRMSASKKPLTVDKEVMKEICLRQLRHHIGDHDYELMMKDRGANFVERTAMGSQNYVMFVLKALYDMDLLLL